MTITLRKEHEKLIAEAMQTGAYNSPDEVIHRALEMLHSQEEWLHEHTQEIADKIDRGFAQFERGEYLSAEDSLADMEKRKAAWKPERKP